MKTYYSKFFNLEINPFGETPDPDFYFGSAQHNLAIRELDLALKHGKGFSLLTGEVGTGKTLLARMILGLHAPVANTALILFPKFNELELLQAICEEFEIPAPNESIHTAKAYVDHLNRFLIASLESGRPSILVIDEAQALNREALETIRLLTNLETRTRKLLQIILVGQPELNEILDRPDLRQLKQRIGAHAQLHALDRNETERYIKSRIEQVVKGSFIKFDPSSIRAIHELSAGTPRRINQICERVLAFSEMRRIRLVEASVVRESLGIKSKSIFSIFQGGAS
ncbi:MAG: AAA family ATPase [Bdellovibrionales bacterium]|nr:AAA family ATPase [Bdellovibrionales bacterium]